MTPTPAQAAAIQDLMDLNVLAVADIERGLGGVLTAAAEAAVHEWLSRAFELGRKHANAVEPQRRCSQCGCAVPTDMLGCDVCK